MVGPNGQTGKQELPQGLTHDHEEPGTANAVKFEKRRLDRDRKGGKKKRSGETAKEYIVRKKELNRKRGGGRAVGQQVYGRRRKGGF